MLKTKNSSKKTPKVVGGYRLVRRVGSGSYSKVFESVQPGTELTVALKIIAKDKLTNAKLQDNLNTEIAIMRDYLHVNVTRLHEAFSVGKVVCLAMEYCAGGDLSLFIKERGKVREDLAVLLLRQLGAGLSFLEGKGVIHRDLKPQNLLLSDHGDQPVLKVADFGFAKHIDAAAMCQTPCGTPLYMAPEVYLLQDYDGKADVWSVGCIYFEMLLGYPPFQGANHRELFMNIRSRGLVIPADSGMSPLSSSLLGRLLEVSPTRRATLKAFCLACGHLEKSLILDRPLEEASHAHLKDDLSLRGSPVDTCSGSALAMVTAAAGYDTDDSSFVLVQSADIPIPSVGLSLFGKSARARVPAGGAELKPERLGAKGLALPKMATTCEDCLRAFFLCVSLAETLVRQAQAYLVPGLPLGVEVGVGGDVHDTAQGRAVTIISRACAVYLQCLYLLRRILMMLGTRGCDTPLQRSIEQSVRRSACRLFEQVLARLDRCVLLVSTSACSSNLTDPPMSPVFAPIPEVDPAETLEECAREVQRASEVQRYRGNLLQATHLHQAALLIRRCVSLSLCEGEEARRC